jgi:hypothetical protein
MKQPGISYTGAIAAPAVRLVGRSGNLSEEFFEGAGQTTATQARADYHPFLSFALGIACATPLLLVDTVNARVIDVLSIFTAGATLLVLIRTGRLHSSVLVFGPLLVLTVIWMGVEVHYSSYLSDDWSAKMILIRWLAAFPTAYWLAELCRHERCRRMVLFGLLAGMVVGIGLVLQDYLTFQLTGQTTAVATVDRPVVVWINGEYRAEGIFGHPNAAAVATLLCVPLIIGLIDEKRLPKLAILLALAAMVGVFHMTRTRSASMTALLLILLWFTFNFRSRIAVRIGLAFVVSLAVYSVVSAFSDKIMPLIPIELNSSLMQRLSNLDNMANNASDRLLTTLTALDLAIHNPLGMGSTYENKLRELTGFSATHNGFVQLALLAGLPLATAVFVAMVKTAGRIGHPQRRTESWVAAYVVMVFFFENLFFVPFMSAIVLWLMLPSIERES